MTVDAFIAKTLSINSAYIERIDRVYAHCSFRMSLPCPVNMAKVRNHGAIIDKPSWIEVLPA
jgi:hypothetical protein